jgi:hypothetical protein
MKEENNRIILLLEKSTDFREPNPDFNVRIDDGFIEIH